MKKNKLMTKMVIATVAICGVSQAAVIYAVNGDGQIRSYTGASAGANPMEKSTFAAGTLVDTVASYGSYLGFTMAADEKIYGVTAAGGVESWSSLSSWLAADASTVLSTDAYGANGVHGISYDSNTGGFYVVYEGMDGNGRDGKTGQYATLADLIDNTNPVIAPTPSATYGGNICNFYYPDDDGSTLNYVGDTKAASSYFQIAGNGRLEGFETLADYIASAGNLSTQSAGGDFSNVGAAFAAIPEPSTMGMIGLSAVFLLAFRRLAI